MCSHLKQSEQTLVTDSLVLDALCESHSSIKYASALMKLSNLQWVDTPISGSTLRALIKLIPKNLVAGALGITEQEVSKYARRMSLSLCHSDIVIDLVLCWLKVSEFFEHDTKDTNEWLLTPLPALNGATPFQLMVTIVGRRTVNKTIDKMRCGEFD